MAPFLFLATATLKFFFSLQRIKKLEKEANYQVLKPLPDCISVSGDLKISLLDIDACCALKSEKDQVSYHEMFLIAVGSRFANEGR